MYSKVLKSSTSSNFSRGRFQKGTKHFCSEDGVVKEYMSIPVTAMTMFSSIVNVFTENYWCSILQQLICCTAAKTLITAIQVSISPIFPYLLHHFL